MVQLDESLGHIRVALQRHAHAKDGQRQRAALELASSRHTPTREPYS